MACHSPAGTASESWGPAQPGDSRSRARNDSGPQQSTQWELAPCDGEAFPASSPRPSEMNIHDVIFSPTFSMNSILLMIPRVKYYSGLKPWPLNLGHLGKQHTRKPSWFGSGLKAEGVKGPAPSHCQPQRHLPWVVPQWAGVGPHHLPTVSAQCPNLSSREYSGQCPPCLWPCGGSTLLSLCCHEKPLKISQMMSVNADGCKQCGNNPHIHNGVKWEN